ncbi:MAG: cell division protein FtsB [Betaproteobacteria bacterium]|nr:cell division protein FtsB [Betaproteobacteria bacterium]
MQYPLWLGKGGWFRVWELARQVAQQKDKNNQLATRNNGLNAEVLDLKQGSEAIEERARAELGMVKPNETYYQIIEPKPAGR